MGTPTFQFKQCVIRHDRCAMKVGTDAVLLGAWADLRGARRLLDAGTGSGVIALMMAQRTEATNAINSIVDAVEIDPDAAQQARMNAEKSPWSTRINVHCADIRTWQAPVYDSILSNPPFFRHALHAPVKTRNQARHDASLSWEELALTVSGLLSYEGRFSLILPVEAEGRFEAICWEYHLYLRRLCEVSAREGQPPKRLLMEFQPQQGLIEHSTLTLQTHEGLPTEAFNALTADFYLC